MAIDIDAERRANGFGKDSLMDALENWDHSTAGAPVSAESQTNLCPLCGTLNHRRSRECFNCGWRGAFPGGNAGADQAGLRTRAEIRLTTPWWQNLMDYLR